MGLLNSSFEDSWDFIHHIIFVKDIELGCDTEFKRGQTRLSIVLHDDIEKFLPYLKHKGENVVLTAWNEPSQEINEQIEHILSPSSQFRCWFPFIPVIGDVHHKCNPHLFVERYITKFQPTAILAGSCPHVLSPVCTRHNIPYSIFPWRLRNRPSFLSSVFKHKDEFITPEHKLRLLYSGNLLSPAHPRRTKAVWLLAQDETIQFFNSPVSLPDEWVETQSNFSGAIFYCSLNSQFSHHLLMPAATSRLMFIDDGVKHNRFIFPLLPSKQRVIPYDYSQLKSKGYLTALLDAYSGNISSHGRDSSDLELSPHTTNQTNSLISEDFRRRYDYYQDIAKPYKEINNINRDCYIALLNIFDILQEIHRILFSQVSILIACPGRLIEAIKLWLEPFRCFLPTFSNNSSSDNLKIVVNLSSSELSLNFERPTYSMENKDSLEKTNQYSLNRFLMDMTGNNTQLIYFKQEITQHLTLTYSRS